MIDLSKGCTLEDMQDAYAISKLGEEGPVKRLNGEQGKLYIKRFPEVNGGKGYGAALSYNNHSISPNKLIMGRQSTQYFYNDGVAISRPRFGNDGYFCVINKKGDTALYGYMNKNGDIVSLSGMDKTALKEHGKTSEKALGRLMKKVAKYLEKYPPKLK